MLDQFTRTRLIFGDEAILKLQRSRVAVFGIGGVGGYAVEALARSGVGTLDLVDSDRVELTNINRQITATHQTLGQYKVDAAKERVLQINPEAVVNTHNCFFLPDTAGQFDFTCYDYVIDAVDTVTAKLELILRANAAGVPVISAMGAGNKTDPTQLRVADIYSTKVCPLARVMRHELKKRGVEKLQVVYSEELPIRHGASLEQEETVSTRRRDTPGSTAFVPSVAGLIIAGEVVKKLIEFNPRA